MDCRNHAGTTGVARCAGCAEPFCQNCLVEIHGQKYCGACKVMTLKGGRAPVIEKALRTCVEARDALLVSIFGAFCLSIFLEPWALSKASKAKRMIDEDPHLTGRAMATAAQVIAVIVLLLWAVATFARFSQLGRG